MKNYKSFILFTITIIRSLFVFAQIDDQYYVNQPPDIDEQHIVADVPFLGTNGAEADYSVWYGCAGNGILHNNIQKPFIWVEGIDLDPFDGNTEASNDPGYPINLYPELARAGFDIIQLDFNSNPTYIQRNAEVLITLIQNLNQQMQVNGSTQEIVVMGTSMGAIITRYALAKMETQGIDHNVRLMISHDGPHQGSNVPWGLQTYLQKITFGQLTTLFAAYHLLFPYYNLVANNDVSGYQAAFQLLRQSPNGLALALRAQLEAELALYGQYPDDCRNIAIANGANNGVGIGDLGDFIHDVNQVQLPVALGIPAWTGIQNLNYPLYTFTWDADIYAADGFGSEVHTIYINGVSEVDIFGVPLFPEFEVINRGYYYGLGNWDVAPGGRQDAGGMLDNDFTFIPTVSALDIATYNPYFNVTTINGFDNTNIPMNVNVNGNIVQAVSEDVAYTHTNGISPFDAIWADNENDEHADLEGSFNFILQEAAPNILVVQDRVVNDNTTFEAQQAVVIGDNVSPSHSIGPVVFQNGANIGIQGGQQIFLEGEVAFRAGSEIEIGIGNYDCD